MKLDVQRGQRTLRFLKQEIELAFCLPNFVGDAIGVFPNALSVLLHPLEALEFVFDPRFDIAQRLQIALVTDGSHAGR